MPNSIKAFITDSPVAAQMSAIAEAVVVPVVAYELTVFTDLSAASESALVEANLFPGP